MVTEQRIGKDVKEAYVLSWHLIRLIGAKLQKSQAGYPVLDKVFERTRSHFILPRCNAA